VMRALAGGHQWRLWLTRPMVKEASWPMLITPTPPYSWPGKLPRVVSSRSLAGANNGQGMPVRSHHPSLAAQFQLTLSAYVSIVCVRVTLLLIALMRQGACAAIAKGTRLIPAKEGVQRLRLALCHASPTSCQ
jgi:hypothetical protein